MLFMDIWTWEPEKRDEIHKIYNDFKQPEGVKVVGEWLDITGNRFFFLKEVDDPKAMLEANDSFLKIAKVDSVPVMENKEVVKLFAGMTA